MSTHALPVLHLMKTYLRHSQIWLYNLLKSTPAINHHIGTREFLPHNYYAPSFRFHKSARGAYLQHVNQLNKRAWRNRWEHLHLWPQRWVLPTEAQEWKQYIKDHQIKLIHLHFAPFACEHVAWLEKIELPWVVSFYGYDYEQALFLRPVLQEQYQRVFHSAQKVFCEGPHGVETLKALGCPKDKLEVVPLGIPLSAEPSVLPKRSGNSFRLLQVADFTPKKGQALSIRAATLAKEQVPELELTLVGRPRDRIYWQQCKALIEQDAPWIKHQPFVNYTGLEALFLQYDAFIHPSQYTSTRDCEGGAPTILFNAQVAGLPIISTKHCDIPNVVKQGESGLLVQEGAVEDLAKTIVKFVELPIEEWEVWQQNTQAWGRKISDIRNGGEVLSKLYHSLIY